MRGQFADTAQILPGRKQVQVSGPVTWDDDEFGAVIHARVTREGVTASGASIFIQATAGSWSATLTAHGGQTLVSGMSKARANATVSLKDGSIEPYNWPDDVNLLD
jgi:hypothetical protein